MPFRERQKYKGAHYEPVVQFDDVTLENGNIVHKMVDVKDVNLPDCDLFDLTNQLNSGVNLQEVNSKILGNKSLDADRVISKYTKKSNNVKENDNEK